MWHYDSFSFFKQEDFMLHTLHDRILHLLRKLLSRFVSPEVITEKTLTELYSLDHTMPDIQRSDEDLLIGVETRQLLQDNEDMSSQEKKKVLR